MIFLNRIFVNARKQHQSKALESNRAQQLDFEALAPANGGSVPHRFASAAASVSRILSQQALRLMINQAAKRGQKQQVRAKPAGYLSKL